MEKVAIALFDIDKTIISHDSMFSLIKYTFKHYPKTRKGTMRFIIYGIRYMLKLIDTKAVKQAAFACINELNEEDLRTFYEIHISNSIYADALDKIKDLRAKGCKILLITASPECYMSFLKEMEEVEDVLGTILLQDGTSFRNQIIGNNCKGEEKVYRINKWLEEKGLEIDYDNSYAFSDSMSDLPMFRLVKNSFIINNRKAKYANKLYWK